MDVNFILMEVETPFYGYAVLTGDRLTIIILFQ